MTCNMMTGIFPQITFEKQKINFRVEIKFFNWTRVQLVSLFPENKKKFFREICNKIEYLFPLNMIKMKRYKKENI